MEKVKRLLEAGSTIPTAIKEALGMKLEEFADKYGIARTTVSNAINGRLRPTDALVQAFIAELGGTALEWRVLLLRSGMSPEELAAMRQFEPSDETTPSAAAAA